MDKLGLAGNVLAAQQHGLGDQVVAQLRVLIITGKIPAGAHLVESQLSANFQVSRGPIRDALAQLEAEGLVESRRRGVFVRGLTTRDIEELYAVREAVELMALRVAATAPESAWDLARDPLVRMHAAAESGDHLGFAHADMAFHDTFYEIGGYRRLRQVWGQYSPTFEVLLELTTAEDVDLGPSYQSHLEIHDQMRAGQLDKALVTLQEHLLGSRSRLLTAVARMSQQSDLEGGR
ncbi:GntR family transcriptional regulator [Microbacterium tumbae]